jgi:hypothetical protein
MRGTLKGRRVHAVVIVPVDGITSDSTFFHQTVSLLEFSYGDSKSAAVTWAIPCLSIDYAKCWDSISFSFASPMASCEEAICA